MRIANREFSPRLWAVLVYLVMLSCMLWLGNWQLDRAALKNSFQQAAQRSQHADAVPITDVTDIDLAAREFQRVSLTGMYDGKRQFLWDNRTAGGQAGFEVIVPVQLGNGRWVLVNRGWIAPGPTREQLPDVSLSAQVQRNGVVAEGYLSRPSKGFASGDAIADSDSWPRLLQYFDYEAIGAALGETVVPAVIQAQMLATDGVTVTALTPKPEWLRANWQPAASGPVKHYSYAFQWFAMAIALSVLFLVVNLRKSVTPNE